ncbi:hypothetical protein [Bacillus wiedmannii]|uniref:hypothetical protein n=1 Tax=Bacillus wiedmannii TaxID=1890302 RepID=UPI0007DB08CD|nr:hypothetical protein [Bacillus wiedmannii]OAK46358.1 hypothetical protein A6285_18290 [Bacillus wiedmannii]OJD55113.1 hypothetical protein BAU22_27495 [Bacillus sp. 4048]
MKAVKKYLKGENGRLLILQEDKMLDLKYLMKNHWAIDQVLLDFYKLRKVQFFKAEMFSTVNDFLILPRIEYLLRKHLIFCYNNFLYLLSVGSFCCKQDRKVA